MGNIPRKIAGIKLRYINIAMLFLFLVGPCFTAFCVSQEKLFWDHMVHNYLRAEGYDVSRFPMIEDLGIKSVLADKYRDILYYADYRVVDGYFIEADVETVMAGIHRDIPYYTDREARALTYFWGEWIKWPFWLLGGLMTIILFARWGKQENQEALSSLSSNP